MLCGLLTAPAMAQGLLPASFEGWTSPSLRRVQAAQIEQLAGPDADILREFGLATAERRDYSRGKESLRATLYEMKDTSAAYGACQFLQSDDLRPANENVLAGISAGRALFLIGQFVLEVKGASVSAISGELKSLTRPLTRFADATPYPTLGSYLPAFGLVRGSERYLLGTVALNRALPVLEGDWLGFGTGAEAQYALYQLKGKEMHVLLVAYPTPQAAGKKAAELKQWFNVAGSAPGRRPMYGRRIHSLLALAFTESREMAETILLDVNYEQQLTLNEPGHRATEQPIIYYIYSILIGTSILCAFAIVAGLAFGGVRLAVKRLLPGKIFDRAEALEVIQLGLGSKPVDMKEFFN